MIIATIIASVGDETIHCEWYQEDFVQYQTIREKIKSFLREKAYLTSNFEVANMKDDLCLQSAH
jgi:hypothetical protein